MSFKVVLLGDKTPEGGVRFYLPGFAGVSPHRLYSRKNLSTNLLVQQGLGCRLVCLLKLHLAVLTYIT
jgi:hypothetical protein